MGASAHSRPSTEPSSRYALPSLPCLPCPAFPALLLCCPAPLLPCPCTMLVLLFSFLRGLAVLQCRNVVGVTHACAAATCCRLMSLPSSTVVCSVPGQSKVIDNVNFRNFLELVPEVRELIADFYARWAPPALHHTPSSACSPCFPLPLPPPPIQYSTPPTVYNGQCRVYCLLYTAYCNNGNNSRVRWGSY